MDTLSQMILELIFDKPLPLSVIAKNLKVNYYKAKIIATELERSNKINKQIQGQKVVFKAVK